jgi:hypothetical protein
MPSYENPEDAGVNDTIEYPDERPLEHRNME